MSPTNSAVRTCVPTVKSVLVRTAALASLAIGSLAIIVLPSLMTIPVALLANGIMELLMNEFKLVVRSIRSP